ncbi:insulinase family protein [candidate division KSB1 bacterium]|nr:insulinase family protein [candidate division KSB1 bacterium]
MKRMNPFTSFILLLFGWILITASPAICEFKLPEYTTFQLDNGLTVYLMEQHEVPLIYMSVVFPAGSVYDGEQSGLASFTADGLLFGTKTHTKQQIEETLDFLGASFETSATKETGEISMSFMSKDQDQVLPILKEIICDPVFEELEFEKRKVRLLTELELAKEQPRSVIGSYYNKFLYGDHPYGNPQTGTKTSAESLTTQDLKDFYTSNYLPSVGAIAVVGDFKSKAMKKNIQDLFSGWTSNTKPAKLVYGEIPNLDEVRILLVNKDDATETRFLIGQFGIRQSNPDFVPVQVINTILGGRFTSWLNDELRVNRGLTYGARSMFRKFKESGTFAMYSYTRTEKTEEAIDVSIEVLGKLHKEGVDEATLISAKNYINGQFPPDYETSGALANLLTEMFVYGFDESFINDFQNNVTSMTVERAREIIATYFPKENLQFVLIGKADEIRDMVKKYGELSEKEIKDDGF